MKQRPAGRPSSSEKIIRENVSEIISAVMDVFWANKSKPDIPEEELSQLLRITGISAKSGSIISQKIYEGWAEIDKRTAGEANRAKSSLAHEKKRFTYMEVGFPLLIGGIALLVLLVGPTKYGSAVGLNSCSNNHEAAVSKRLVCDK